MVDVLKQLDRQIEDWRVSLFDVTSHPSGFNRAQRVVLQFETDRWELKGVYSWLDSWQIDTICANLIATLPDSPAEFTGPPVTTKHRQSICAMTDRALGLEL